MNAIRPLLVLLLPVLGACGIHAPRAGFTSVPTGDVVRPSSTALVVDERARIRDSDQDWIGTAAGLIGARKLEEDFWDPVENHFVFGGEFALRPPDSVLGFEIGTSISFGVKDNVAGTGIDVTASTLDFYFGPRVTFGDRDGGMHPYAGAGISFLLAELEGYAGGLRVSDDDWTVAGYAHAGVTFDVGESLFLGFDVRSTFGSDVTLFGAHGDADSYQIAAVIGTTL